MHDSTSHPLLDAKERELVAAKTELAQAQARVDLVTAERDAMRQMWVALTAPVVVVPADSTTRRTSPQEIEARLTALKELHRKHGPLLQLVARQALKDDYNIELDENAIRYLYRKFSVPNSPEQLFTKGNDGRYSLAAPKSGAAV